MFRFRVLLLWWAMACGLGGGFVGFIGIWYGRVSLALSLTGAFALAALASLVAEMAIERWLFRGAP